MYLQRHSCVLRHDNTLHTLLVYSYHVSLSAINNNNDHDHDDASSSSESDSYRPILPSRLVLCLAWAVATLILNVVMALLSQSPPLLFYSHSLSVPGAHQPHRDDDDACLDECPEKKMEEEREWKLISLVALSINRDELSGNPLNSCRPLIQSPHPNACRHSLCARPLATFPSTYTLAFAAFSSVMETQ